MNNISIKVEPDLENGPGVCHCEDVAQYKDKYIVNQDPNGADGQNSLHSLSQILFIDESATMQHNVSNFVRPHDPDICTTEMRPVEWDSTTLNQSWPTASRFKCDVCDKVFNTAGSLTRHSRAHTSSRPRTSNRMELTRSRIKDFQRHSKAATCDSNATVKKFKCDVCDKEFNTAGQLKRHTRVHSNDTRPMTSVSKRKTSRDSGKTAQTEHESTVKYFECDVCGKPFKLAGHLTRHSRVHSGHRPFKCSVCEKTFKDSTNLKRHKRIHSGERPYKCDTCQKSFIQSKDLRNHKITHTGQRPYKCEVCKRSFTSSSYLAVHRRIHSDSRPYTCGVCHMSFHASNTLARHQRTHTGEKPYECEICKKAFTRPATLKKHCQKNHIDCVAVDAVERMGKPTKHKVKTLIIETDTESDIQSLSEYESESDESFSPYESGSDCVSDSDKISNYEDQFIELKTKEVKIESRRYNTRRRVKQVKL